jgi:hypothetical protein
MQTATAAALPAVCAGDSRAVLSRGGKAIQVTDDHKPEREDEAVSDVCACASQWSSQEAVMAGLAGCASGARARCCCTSAVLSLTSQPCLVLPGAAGACGEGGRPGAVLEWAQSHGRARDVARDW